MTDAETDLMLRNLATLLTVAATIMEKNEMEEEARVLNERANETFGHLNKKQNEAAHPSKFITDAVRDLGNRPWPDDLNAPDRRTGKEKKKERE